ncbi:hypothetical protein, partial [Emticicia sp. 17c]|uniref:hypothetical protein n=1 Tax=Emticicia sp. 17c TaxID=3127704 RepID=UPI00301CFA8A
MKATFTDRFFFVLYVFVFCNVFGALANISNNTKKNYISANYTDLSLTKVSNKSIAQIGEQVTFVLTLTNETQAPATGISVKDYIPNNIIINSITPSTGTYTQTLSEVTWNVGSLAASTNATLTIVTTVLSSGSYYNKAEIFSTAEIDLDSTPNNDNLLEDDIAIACVSVPFKYCPSDLIEIDASAPLGYTGYQWLKNGAPILGATQPSYKITDIGTYTYTISSIQNNISCPATLCCPIIVERYPTITINPTVTNISCNGLSDGVINVAVTGTGGPWQYSLNNGAFQGSNIFSNLPSGSYTISVIDVSNNCISSVSATITQPQKIALSPVLTCDASTGLGNVTLSATGGSNSYTYNINNGVFTSSNIFSNLTNGSYTFLAKDANGCTGSANIQVSCNQANDLALACNTVANGNQIGSPVSFNINLLNEGATNITGIKVKVQVPSFALSGLTFIAPAGTTYDSNTGIWDIPSLSSTTSSITLQIKGTLNQAGVISVPAEIIQMNGLDIDSTPNNGIIVEDDITMSCCISVPYKYCKDDPIEIQATALSGLSNYQWYKDGIAIAGATQQVYTITQIGSYTYSAIDTNNGNCQYGLCCPITVELYPEFTISAVATYDCAGATITVSTNGGTGPFVYSLNNGAFQSLPSFTNIPQGVYTINVKDLNGCASTTQIVINKVVPEILLLTADKTSLCTGEVATLTASNCSGTLSWRKDGQLVNYPNPAVVAQSGVYTATCTTSCGTSAASVTITVGSFPNTPSITADKTSLCAGESATLTASNCTGTVNWLLNGNLISNANPTLVTQAGIYTATCTTSCGTSVASNSIQISIGSIPNAPSITADKTSLCAGESATLTAVNCSGTVNWLLNGNLLTSANPTFVTQAGIYTATCTTNCGTSVASNSIQISTGGIPNAPTITADKTSLCVGESATLTAANCSGTVRWLLNGNLLTSANPTFVNQAGIYTATCTTNCGTSVASNSIQISTGGIPNAPSITADKTSLCAGESATLTAANCSGTVRWLLNGNLISNANPTFVTQAGIYTATCTTNCGTSVASNSIQISTGGVPNAPTITADKTSLCAGESATLTAANCSGTVKWLLNGNFLTSANPTFVNQTGVYTATCTTNCGTSLASSSIQISTGGIPNAPAITTDKTSLCAGESATLTATNCSGTVRWLLNGNLVSNANPTFVTQAGIYTATCTTNCGTSVASNSIQISTGGIPNAPIITADKTSLCAGESATLTAANCSGTVSWRKDGQSVTYSNPAVVTQSGVYTATCTTSCGTSVASNSIQITTGGIPNAPTITADKTSLCAGESATLTAANCSGTVNWLLNGILISNANPTLVTQAGIYTATCTTSCGTSVASSSVTITTGGLPNAPTITANKTSLCAGESATLTAANCSGTVNWLLNGILISNANPTLVTQAGIYTATCTTNCGTSVASNSIQISTGGIPNAPSITTDKTSLCAGESATLTAANCSGTLSWRKDGQSVTYPNPAVVTQSGIYTATCTTNCGISVASNSIQITTGGIPNAPTITADKTSLCAGESATLTAANCSGTVNWLLNGSLISNANPTFVTQAGIYTATCTTSCGTSVASNNIQISIGSIPNAPTITADKTSLCAGESATLTATNCSGTLSWRKDGQSVNYSNPAVVTQSGVYTATCTTNCGTSIASNSVTITTGNLPNAPTITADKTSLCAGDFATLTAANCSGTLSWRKDGQSVNYSNPAVVTQSGVYTATCTTNCGTSVASNSVTITTGNLPNAPTITADKTSLCAGDFATLTAANCSGTLSWRKDGQSVNYSNPAIVTQSGIYTATCTTSCGTSVASNSVTITTGNLPNAPTITADKTSLCAGDFATLTAANCSGTLSWRKDGQSVNYSNPAIVTQSGIYTATCTTSCGTSVASNSVTITTGNLPNAPTLTADKTSLCAGDFATLTAANCSGTLSWRKDGQSVNYSNPAIVTQSGSYTATCTTNCGTSIASNSIQISTGGIPNAPTLTADKTSLCAGDFATLTAANCSGTLSWRKDGQSVNYSNPAVVTQSGVYTATCTTNCGTSVASNSIQISIGGIPNAPTLTADKTSLCAGDFATLTAANCSGTLSWRKDGQSVN